MTDKLIPQRGLLLVRPVETDERLPGSVIVLLADTRERMTANQCEVVTVSDDAVCDDEDCERFHYSERSPSWPEPYNVHPCAIRVGDWLLVRPRSFIAGPDIESPERFVHQDDVWAILSTETT